MHSEERGSKRSSDEDQNDMFMHFDQHTLLVSFWSLSCDFLLPFASLCICSLLFILGKMLSTTLPEEQEQNAPIAVTSLSFYWFSYSLDSATIELTVSFW